MASADEIGRMLRKQPSVVVYKNLDELITLKDWLYNFSEDHDNRYRAVQRVKAISSRGRVPHAIESTALLTSICIKDPCMGISKATQLIQDDANVLQLSYSMALTRFVNGLLDPLQQSNYAIPLHQLAKSIQVPSFFVELRHMATHERLPSLNILQMACKDALNWLYDNYWNKIEDQDDSDLGDSGDEETSDELTLANVRNFINQQVKSQKTPISDIIASLKVYKKIRKQDLDYVYKYGNSSETGLKYWKAIKELQKYQNKNTPLLLNVMIFKDFLIYREDSGKENSKSKKINSYLTLLYKLYGPLLEAFGNRTKFQLLETLINYLFGMSNELESAVNKRLGFEFVGSFEKLQACKWISHLIQTLFAGGEEVKIDELEIKLINVIDPILKDDSFGHSEFKFTILQGVNNIKLLGSLREIIETQIKTTTIQTHLNAANVVETLDSILGSTPIDHVKNVQQPKEQLEDQEQLEPKHKKQKTVKYFLFDPHENWEPTPFGSTFTNNNNGTTYWS